MRHRSRLVCRRLPVLGLCWWSACHDCPHVGDPISADDPEVIARVRADARAHELHPDGVDWTRPASWLRR